MVAHITEKVLGALPGDGSETTAAMLATETGLDRNAVYNCCNKLRRRGLAEKSERGRYRLTTAGCVARDASQPIRSGPTGPNDREVPRPVSGTLRARLWKALRRLGKATIPELCQLASRGAERAAESNAGKYLRQLERCGFVAQMRRREPGTAPTSNGFVRYLLVPDRDPGPEAPVVRERLGLLYDPNKRKSYSLDTGEEVGP